MRYVLNLVDCKVKFTHAGHGTANVREIGEPFVAPLVADLGHKNILMFRDPIDTAVSLYFQLHKTDLAPSSDAYPEKSEKLRSLGRLPPKEIDDFVLHPIWGVEQICKFNRAWLNLFNQVESGLVIQYETAKADPEATIRSLLAFVGVHGFDPADITMRSNFDAMKALELTGAGKHLGLHGMRDNDPASSKVRRGVVGGYRDHLTKETIANAKAVSNAFGFAGSKIHQP